VLIPALATILGGTSTAPDDPFVSLVERFLNTELDTLGVVAVTVVKLAAFIGFMLVVGRRLIPLILHSTAHTGSRELFRLAVLAIETRPRTPLSAERLAEIAALYQLDPAALRATYPHVRAWSEPDRINFHPRAALLADSLEMLYDLAARIQRQQGSRTDAEQTLREGIAAARVMEERFLLPRLLAAMSELRSSQRRFGEAATLLDEAADMLSGLFTSASSPWVQSRLVGGMDEVFAARIRLEGARDEYRSQARMAQQFLFELEDMEAEWGVVYEYPEADVPMILTSLNSVISNSLTSFSLNDSVIEIQGFTRDPEQLTRLLVDMPIFERIEQSRNISQSNSASGDRFGLRLTLSGYDYAEYGRKYDFK